LIRKNLIDEKGYLMICGNKKGMGHKLNEVLINNGILSDIEINEQK
jgi:sulfite reductase alpha subunit-like flavoprotein